MLTKYAVAGVAASALLASVAFAQIRPRPPTDHHRNGACARDDRRDDVVVHRATGARRSWSA